MVKADQVPPPQAKLTLFEPQDYPPFLIGPGDILKIFVYGEGVIPVNLGSDTASGSSVPQGSGFPDEYMVDSSGVIVLPLAGQVKVAGLTQTQAGAEVAKHLLRFEKNPQITVIIADSATYAVSIMGEVYKPGKYPVRGNPGLLGMLAAAGGPTEHADLNGTMLIRGNRRIPLPLKQYLLDAHCTESQPLLYPGDTIMVPMSHWPVSFGDWGAILGILTGIIATAAIVSEAEYQRGH